MKIYKKPKLTVKTITKHIVMQKSANCSGGNKDSSAPW